MPKINRYVVYNIKTSLYYNVEIGAGDCKVNINNATFFSESEYKFRKSSENYLLQDEKFVKIGKSGNKKIIQ